MALLLGCIADDLTGATDLAMTLVQEGLKTVQIVGVPDINTLPPEADAIVIALKSRTLPCDQAISQSLACCNWLTKAGSQQIFFKYCSTFDSTADGNIGPVIDALMHNLECRQTIVCPAFPQNGRTVYKGHLFVNHSLLSDSPMRHHPLTPMTESHLARLLETQSKADLNHIYFEDVQQGADQIEKKLCPNADKAATIHIVDALTDTHLRDIGHACHDLRLITGGSAVAQGLADNFRTKKQLLTHQGESGFNIPAGASVILSGSCSEMTLSQIAHAQAEATPSFHLNATDIMMKEPVVEAALDWAKSTFTTHQKPILIYASTDPASLNALHQKWGHQEVGAQVELVLAEIATRLADLGVRRYVVAGGETSGAVINALNVKMMEIGPAIAPGVPWTKSIGNDPFLLALKSGNFGKSDFFLRALAQLDEYAVIPT